MKRLINRLLEQIKKITLKGVIGWSLLFVGIACLVLVFSCTPTAVNVSEATYMGFTTTEWLYMALACAVLIIGSICIWLGIKINPEPFLKALREDIENKPVAKVHNYSNDFAEICERLDHQCTIQRVDNLIELIESEDK